MSFWLPGSYGSMAATLQEPGWALSVTDYHATVSAGAAVAQSREIATGRLPANLTATVNDNYKGLNDIALVEPTYVFATPILGGQGAVALSGEYGRAYSTLAGSISGMLNTGGAVPFARTDNIADTVWGFGDLSPEFSLRWNQGVNSVMAYVSGNIPVGAYSATRLANLGIGFGVIDVGGAYTYYNTETGNEFSGTLGFTYNFTNPSTQYQNGVDMHFDWGASHSLANNVQIGLVGYVYREIGCDSGAGDRLGCFQSQVVGIGPQVGYTFPVSGVQGNLSVKTYWEFAGENRPDGWNVWLALTLSPAPPSQAASSAPPMLTKATPHS